MPYENIHHFYYRQSHAIVTAFILEGNATFQVEANQNRVVMFFSGLRLRAEYKLYLSTFFITN